MEITEQVTDNPTIVTTHIIINGRLHEVGGEMITFEQVIILAFGSISNDPNIVYTVVYKKGPAGNPEGSMVRGDLVKIKNEMVFNATLTDKS